MPGAHSVTPSLPFPLGWGENEMEHSQQGETRQVYFSTRQKSACATAKEEKGSVYFPSAAMFRHLTGIGCNSRVSWLWAETPFPCFILLPFLPIPAWTRKKGRNWPGKALWHHPSASWGFFLLKSLDSPGCWSGKAAGVRLRLSRLLTGMKGGSRTSLAQNPLLCY